MMGLTDRLEPWARRFQRKSTTEPEAEPARASLRARRDDDLVAPEHRTGRFTRRAMQEQERS